jgi:predicted lipoprotein with Yx(FWY)xxD motif
MSAFGIGKLGQLSLGAAGATALVALVAGCGSSSSSAVAPAAGGSSSAPSSTSASSAPAASASASSLKTRSTSIGTVLVAPSGKTVYELVGATAANNMCSGACLTIWPEVTANGTQVVVNGHPAFTFAGDSAAGQTKGQNVTDQWGKWLALDASGNPISAPAAATSKAPASPAPAATSKAPSGGGAAF